MKTGTLVSTNSNYKRLISQPGFIGRITEVKNSTHGRIMNILDLSGKEHIINENLLQEITEDENSILKEEKVNGFFPNAVYIEVELVDGGYDDTVFGTRFYGPYLTIEQANADKPLIKEFSDSADDRFYTMTSLYKGSNFKNSYVGEGSMKGYPKDSKLFQ